MPVLWMSRLKGQEADRPAASTTTVEPFIAELTMPAAQEGPTDADGLRAFAKSLMPSNFAK